MQSLGHVYRYGGNVEDGLGIRDESDYKSIESLRSSLSKTADVGECDLPIYTNSGMTKLSCSSWKLSQGTGVVQKNLI